MMPSYASMNAVVPVPTGSVADPFLDDISRQMQMSMSQSRRYSRGSNGHGSHALHIGAPIRVTKPSSSASNSPRSAMLQARRRTVMNLNDCLVSRRNQQLLEHAHLPSPAIEPSMDDPMKKAARPVSWHPSSSHLAHYQTPQHQHQQQQYQHQHQATQLTQYPFPPYNELDLYQQYQQQFPPTPVAYSGYNSPAAFSPLSLPYSGFEAPQYLAAAPESSWASASTNTQNSASNVLPSPSTLECPGLTEHGHHQPSSESARSSSSSLESSSSSSSTATSRWNSFLTHGFNKATAPPTPDAYPTVPPPEPVIPSDEESIPYQPLEDDEEEGEILIGMGLYDPPEKPLVDPTLETYRNSVAHLLGSAYNYPEPTGKGLKLEDAWEPPAKKEEEEDNYDDDDDDDDDESNSDNVADEDDKE